MTMEMSQQQNEMLPDPWQTFFDETARDLNENEAYFSETSFDLNEFLSNELESMPVFLNDVLLSPVEFGPNLGCNDISGDLLEVVHNEIVASDPACCSPGQSESLTNLDNFVLPQSINPSLEASEIIVDEYCYTDDTNFHIMAVDDVGPLTVDSSYSPSSGTDFDQISESSTSESSSIKNKRRGRPRKAPEEHLQKLKGKKISKKDKKTIKNNAASIKYRHKKASEREHTQELHIKESRRNEILKRKHAKLERSIELLKQITRSRFS